MSAVALATVGLLAIVVINIGGWWRFWRFGQIETEGSGRVVIVLHSIEGLVFSETVKPEDTNPKEMHRMIRNVSSYTTDDD